MTAHVERLQFIRHCRSLDMPLNDVRLLLSLRDAPGESCQEVNQLLDQRIVQVEQRIAELNALQGQLRYCEAVAKPECGAGLRHFAGAIGGNVQGGRMREPLRIMN
jgi:DNA-binding transcriptional MerR regulator